MRPYLCGWRPEQANARRSDWSRSYSLSIEERADVLQVAVWLVDRADACFGSFAIFAAVAIPGYDCLRKVRHAVPPLRRGGRAGGRFPLENRSACRGQTLICGYCCFRRSIWPLMRRISTENRYLNDAPRVMPSLTCRCTTSLSRGQVTPVKARSTSPGRSPGTSSRAMRAVHRWHRYWTAPEQDDTGRLRIKRLSSFIRRSSCFAARRESAISVEVTRSPRIRPPDGVRARLPPPCAQFHSDVAGSIEVSKQGVRHATPAPPGRDRRSVPRRRSMKQTSMRQSGWFARYCAANLSISSLPPTVARAAVVRRRGFPAFSLGSLPHPAGLGGNGVKPVDRGELFGAHQIFPIGRTQRRLRDRSSPGYRFLHPGICA